MIPQWQQDIINSNIKRYVYVIEWLDQYDNVIDEMTLDVINGGINFDISQNNRRSVRLTLQNFDKKYIPYPSSNLWINNKFRLKAGYLYGNNQRLLYDQGVFVLGNPSILSSASSKTVELEGLDKWTLLDGTIGGQFKNKILIPVGTRVDTAVRLIVQEFEDNYIIDECDIELPYTIERDNVATTASELLTEISEIVSYECYYDNYGRFRFHRHLDVEDYQTTPPSYFYTSDYMSYNPYIEGKRKLNWINVKNSVLVIGELLENGVQIKAEAKDDTDSELSISKIGERLLVVNDNKIWDNDLAQYRADWELNKHIRMAEEVQITIHPNFSHTLGDIINITDKHNGSDGNYLIQSIGYSINFDTVMTLGVWRVRDWR